MSCAPERETRRCSITWTIFFFGIEQTPADGRAPTFQGFLALCDMVGVPLQADKCVPPTTRLEILGIIVDTTTMTFELPAKKKIARLTEGLTALLKRRRATRRELLSHACRCVPPDEGSCEESWTRLTRSTSPCTEWE